MTKARGAHVVHAQAGRTKAARRLSATQRATSGATPKRKEEKRPAKTHSKNPLISRVGIMEVRLSGGQVGKDYGHLAS